MNQRPSVHRLSLAVFIVIAVICAATGRENSRAAEPSTIRIEAGETLEIGMDTGSANSQFSWILTKDRKFQSAQRTRFFQTRLAEVGTYVLDVSVQNPVTTESNYRAFTIVVTEPSGNVPVPLGDKNKPLEAKILTDAPMQQNTSYIGSGGGILKIDPSASNGNIASYSIDLDTSVDSDGDGNGGNDIDNVGTLSEKSGTPVYVFMLPKNAERRVKLSVSDLSNIEPKATEVQILFGTAPFSASASSASSAGEGVIVAARDGQSVRFSLTPEEAETIGKGLLYEWSFGDRSSSLLTSPVHSYGAPGSYTVSVRIRDITNAEVLYEATEIIVIDTVQSSSSVSSASTSSVQSSEPTVDEKSSFSLMGILQVGFIIVLLLALAIGLYALLTWIKRRTTSGLQKTLEKMEGAIVNKDVKANDAKPAVMKLRKDTAKPEETVKKQETVSEREREKQDFKTEKRSNETPVANSGPVPAWLAKASAPKPPAPQTVVSPVKSLQAAAASPPSPPAPSKDASVPAWLKTAPTTTAPTPAAPPPTPPVATAPVVPAAPPAPTPTPAPKPEPSAATLAVPVRAPTPTPTPAAPAPALAAPAPTPAPKPEPSTTTLAAPVQAPAAPKAVTPTPVTTPAAKPSSAETTSPLVKAEPAPAEKPPVTAALQPKIQDTPTPAVIPPSATPVPPSPAPEVKEVSSTLQAPPTPVPVPEVKPTTQTDTQNKDDEDPPIAFIQADSLSK